MEPEAGPAGRHAPEVIPPVPVVVTGYQTVDQVKGPDFGAYGTISFPAGAGQAVPLLPYDGHRYEARLMVYSSAALVPLPYYNVVGVPVLAPIASQSLTGSLTVTVAGWYNVTYTVVLAAAPTTADIDNTALYIGSGSGYIVMPNGDQVGAPYQSGPLLNYFAAGQVISTRAVGAGSGAASYQVSVNVNPAVGPPSTAVPAGVWIGSEGQVKASPPLGMFVPAGKDFPLHHNQKVWVVGDGANSVSVSYQIERFDSPADESADY